CALPILLDRRDHGPAAVRHLLGHDVDGALRIDGDVLALHHDGTSLVGAPTWPPYPQTFGVPRGTRGTPRSRWVHAAGQWLLGFGGPVRVVLDAERLHFRELLAPGGLLLVTAAALGDL